MFADSRDFNTHFHALSTLLKLGIMCAFILKSERKREWKSKCTRQLSCHRLLVLIFNGLIFLMRNVVSISVTNFILCCLHYMDKISTQQFFCSSCGTQHFIPILCSLSSHSVYAQRWARVRKYAHTYMHIISLSLVRQWSMQNHLLLTRTLGNKIERLLRQKKTFYSFFYVFILCLFAIAVCVSCCARYLCDWFFVSGFTCWISHNYEHE